MLLALFCCCSCASPQAWHIDSIATGNPQFDSSRLSYQLPTSHMQLEMLRVGEEISAFLFVKQGRFASSPLDAGSVNVTLLVEGQSTHELAPSREGRMRIKLSKPMTEQLIQALQEEKEVAIVLDGFQEKISPASFAERYEELTHQRWDFMNFIKGPFG